MIEVYRGVNNSGANIPSPKVNETSLPPINAPAITIIPKRIGIHFFFKMSAPYAAANEVDVPLAPILMDKKRAKRKGISKVLTISTKVIYKNLVKVIKTL